MSQLTLTEEGRKAFEAALNDAYKAGYQNATFLMGSAPELITSQEDEVKKIVDKYVTK